MEFGFLREYTDDVIQTTSTGLHVTGLNHYLSDIFNPEIYGIWIHDKSIPKVTRKRPDYRNDTLKLIVEFDGLPHYVNPDVIQSDMDSYCYYKELGYDVIRIPYFIQLTPQVLNLLFAPHVNISIDVINRYRCLNDVISFDLKSRNTPAYMCSLGVARCKYELYKFNSQYESNISYLKDNADDIRSGYTEFIDSDISRFKTLFIDI